MGLLFRLVWIAILGTGITIFAAQLGCPIGCICDYNGYTIRCSNGNISAFPRYMVWCPEYLEMENNTIKLMPSNALTPCGDTIINMTLQWCGIEVIEVGVFADFYKLNYLDLRHNKVKKIHENLFLGLTNIKRVYFQYNEIEAVEMDPNSSYEADEITVNTLYMGFNKMTRFEGGLPRGVRYMNVTDNLIEDIVPGTAVFALLSVDTVFFNRNRIKRIRRRAFCGFVNDTWFRNEDSPLYKLHFIVLDDNIIESVEPGAFEGLPVIQNITMNGNRLMTLAPGMFQGLTKLRSLTITRSQVENIELEAFRDLDTLFQIDLSNNSIKTLKRKAFVDLPLLERMQLSFNKLENVKGEMFYGLNETKLLNLSYNQMVHLRESSFKSMEKLEILDLSHNKITKTDKDVFLNMTSLDTLIMDYNEIVKVQPLTYREIPNLRELSFRFNKITSLSPQLDDQLNILRTDLYLRGNTIEVPEPKEVMKLSTLSVLDLSNNLLEDLPPGVFREVSRLFSLRLNDNKFKFLRVQALKGLRRLYELNLHNNSLRCDCNMVGTWVYSTLNKIDTKVYGGEDLKCSSPAKYKGESWQVLREVENSTACEPLKPLGAGNQAGLFVLGPILLVVIGVLTFYTQKLMRKYLIK